MKGEKGQVSHFKPMQIDTDLGYDVYKIFINVTSLNEIKAQDKIDFFSYWIDKGMCNKKISGVFARLMAYRWGEK